MFKKKRGTHEINVQQAAPFCQCFLCTCTSPGWHSTECQPGGRVQRGSIVFSRQRVLGGSGDAKRRKKFPAGRTSSPLRQDHRRIRVSSTEGEKLGVSVYPDVRANSVRPPSRRASARARSGPARPSAAGKPGRGAGAGPAAPGRRRTPAVVVVALAT